MIRNNIKRYLLILSLVGLYITNPTATVGQKVDSLFGRRKIIFWSGYGLGYTIGMTWLYQSWYSHYPRSSFHWFDDSKEWLQMDKAGHLFSSYQLSKASYKGFCWAGYNPKQAVLYSSIVSFATITSIEAFDAFSIKWGASYSDILANATGTIIFLGQHYFLDEPMFTVKFSYHPTSLADKRPDALGEYWYEEILKDYNGQTYWLSINMHDAGIKPMPSWLNIAIGYSGYNMLNGTDNKALSNEDKAYRQYFLSLDINPRGIKTNNKLLKTILKSFDIIKFPLPALEFSKNKLKGHGIYF
ncbi:MAG: DUF2279 domain-containing protein [Bacteroidales bacterium]|nr:DUF2279 domain-containing protein [Bacteroidales bacterium]